MLGVNFLMPACAAVTVVGGSEVQRRLVKNGAKYFLKYLLSISTAKRQLCASSIDLKVELQKQLYRQDSTKGDLEPIDDDPHWFELRLDSSMNPPGLLKTLAHECVHVVQYATGEMAETNAPLITKWRGKKVDWSNIHYYDQPWEVEAYGRETGLYERFISAERLAGERWYVDYDYQ